MTEHQPGTVLPLSECKPGWLVKCTYPDGKTDIFAIHGNEFSDYPVTLISTAPGWMPVGEGDPRKCKRVHVCWQNGLVESREYAEYLGRWLSYHDGKALFWRDASADVAPAQAPDLAARVAELERRFEAHSHRIDVDPFYAGGPTLEYRGEQPEPIFTTSRKATPLDADGTTSAAIDRAFRGSIDDEIEALSRKPTDPVLTDDLCPTCDGKGVVPKCAADPEPGVMTEREIIRAGRLAYTSYANVQNGSHTEGLNEALWAVLKATRASIRAQLAANEEGAVEAFEVEWGDLNRGPVAALSAALKAHKEGV